VVADALSRPPVPPSPSLAAACVKAPSGSQAATRREGRSNSSSSSAVASVVAHAPLGDVDYAAMAAAQGSCPEVQKVAASPALQVWRVQIHGADVLCDVTTGVARPLVPAAFRTAVFAAIHGLANPGIWATRRLVLSRFVWHGSLRRGRMVPGLPDLPEGKGDAAAGSGDTEHPSARAAVHEPPCRFGGATPHLGGGLQVSLHHH
jgi:hypothetical protein